MGETTIKIPMSRYNELVRKEEQLAILQRKIAKENYINVSEIKIILDVNEAEQAEE